MKKIISIAKKEFVGNFQTPLAFIVLFVTFSVFNVFFFMILDKNNEATLRDIFQVMEFLFVFISPILTMRIFSQESSAGTLEFLMTTPTKRSHIVLGKYMGSFLFYSSIVSIALLYYAICEFYSHLDFTATLLGLLGIWLEGLFFMSVGLLASSWTRSQIIAAISSYAVLFLLYFAPSFQGYVSGAAEFLLRKISVSNHSINFFVGIFQLSDIIYFISGIMFCIFLSKNAIVNRD